MFLYSISFSLPVSIRVNFSFQTGKAGWLLNESGNAAVGTSFLFLLFPLQFWYSLLFGWLWSVGVCFILDRWLSIPVYTEVSAENCVPQSLCFYCWIPLLGDHLIGKFVVVKFKHTEGKSWIQITFTVCSHVPKYLLVVQKGILRQLWSLQLLKWSAAALLTGMRFRLRASWIRPMSEKVKYSSQCLCGVMYKIHCDFNNGKSGLGALLRSKVYLHFQSF